MNGPSSADEVDRLMKVAMSHLQARRWAEAAKHYTSILDSLPEHAEALHLCGMAQFHRGQIELAAQRVTKAIGLSPDASSYRNSMGLIELGRKRPTQAAEEFRESIRLKDDVSEVWTNLAQALEQSGSLCESAEACGRAVMLSLGTRKIELLMRQGYLLQRAGTLALAADCYRAIISIRPNHASAHAHLGSVLDDLGDLDNAEEFFSTAVRLDPNDASIHNNWGLLSSKRQNLTDAASHFRRALELRPKYPSALNNLAAVLRDQGQTVEAVECYRRALSLRPDWSQVHSNLLMTLHYDPRYIPVQIADEHRRWSELHAGPFTSGIHSHSNDSDPRRRLRIGYVSHDFREHAVASFLLPVLEAHDHAQVEVFCYSNLNREDAVTARFKQCADNWRNVSALQDDQLSDLIRQDRIDILVDLSGHTGMNRLLVFARKPAPVQATWLGYPDSTGLSTIDYRLTDAHADPPDQTEHFHTERLIRLDPTFLCYRPHDNAPEVAPAPALKNGFVTFGSFNGASKLSDLVLDLWAQILASVPGSRLLLKAKGLSDTICRQRIVTALHRRNVNEDRLTVLGHVPTARKHFELYGQLDLALDSFPYHGTTTTCEAMWMGVPVITLVGSTHVARVGASVLNVLDLRHLIACDAAQYVHIAKELASDASKLDELRQSMRQRMVNSPLTDSSVFAKRLEFAYRQMWQGWCNRQTVTS